MNLNCSFLKLKIIIDNSGINHYTITEETKRDTLIKYIKEFDENQVPYFIVRYRVDKIKKINVYNKKLELISIIS